MRLVHKSTGGKARGPDNFILDNGIPYPAIQYPAIQPSIPCTDFFDESFSVSEPWGKRRAPTFEVPTISHPFYHGVKQSPFEFTY
jgi:hypothetical protein